jgi:predicted site-specific integrase-resolvase
MTSATLTPPSPLLVPLPVAAEMLGISQRSLHAWTVPRGPIPVVRVPGKRTVRYSVDALQKWIEQQQQDANQNANLKVGQR